YSTLRVVYFTVSYCYFFYFTFFLFFFSFFLLCRCPPTSPLFPYTTLFRSSCSARCSICDWSTVSRSSSRRQSSAGAWLRRLSKRSEEHTSELQSLRHLVCRLLLEKKKINFITFIWIHLSTTLITLYLIVTI